MPINNIPIIVVILAMPSGWYLSKNGKPIIKYKPITINPNPSNL